MYRLSTCSLLFALYLFLHVFLAEGYAPQGPPRWKRDSEIESLDPERLQSRQGRLGDVIQNHQSTVKYANRVQGTQAKVRPVGSNSDGPQPPAPPIDGGPSPPAPPFQVNDIRCMKTPTREYLTASISLPSSSPSPVFDDKPSINPVLSRTCQIVPAETSGTFKLQVSNLDACAVTSCPQDSQEWLCLTLRFPVLSGLKLPEDEVVTLRCKPQDRTAAEKKDIDFNGSEVEAKSRVTFSGGRQEFLCEIGLFRQLPGTSFFSQRIGPGTSVELGEEVQLRSIVRSNDGWHYSKMTDVVIRRLTQQTSQSEGTATLVLSDGCRNSKFKAIAPQHPIRDSRSSLLNNFNFRVFLFQDMQDGDTILISARVLACVEAIDCSPSLCNDDRGQGYGRKRRHAFLDDDSFLRNSTDGKTREIVTQHLLYPNGTTVPVNGNLKGWQTDLALRVATPGDHYGRTKEVISLETNCFLYLMLTVAMATALGVTMILVGFYCICTCNKNKKTLSNATGTTTPAFDAFMETCALDALSRSVRQKKKQVHEEMFSIYKSNVDLSALPCNNYSQEAVKATSQRPEEVNSGRCNITTVTVGSQRSQQEAALRRQLNANLPSASF